MAIVVGPTCWQFNARRILGNSFEGGYLICNSGGVAWIVAPNTTEVSRTWFCRNDAVTTAQANATCGDWFVPTRPQLQNPGWICRTYWDSYSLNCYWSSTPRGGDACFVCFPNGGSRFASASIAWCVRAFRCVTY